MTHSDSCRGVPWCEDCNQAAMAEGFRGERPEPEFCPHCGQQTVEAD